MVDREVSELDSDEEMLGFCVDLVCLSKYEPLVRRIFALPENCWAIVDDLCREMDIAIPDTIPPENRDVRLIWTSDPLGAAGTALILFVSLVSVGSRVAICNRTYFVQSTTIATT